MTIVLAISDIHVPDDFPVGPYEAVLHRLDHERANTNYFQFMEAWNAIAIRFAALDESDRAFTASIGMHGPAPAQPIRFQQERDLFHFFSNAFSAFDAFAYAVYAIGSIFLPTKFALQSAGDERNAGWPRICQRYDGQFGAVLNAIADDDKFNELRGVRNLLTHRAVPRRHFRLTVGTTRDPRPDAEMPRAHLVVDMETTASGQREIVRLLTAGLEATDRFVASQPN